MTALAWPPVRRELLMATMVVDRDLPLLPLPLLLPWLPTATAALPLVPEELAAEDRRR